MIAIGIPGSSECDPWLDPDWCQGGGGSGECMYSSGIVETASINGCPTLGAGTGDGPGGDGGGATLSTPTGQPIANDEDARCVDLGCRLRAPTPAEIDSVSSLIAQIRTDGFCGEVRANAQAMVERGLQVWDNRVYVNVNGTDRTLLGEAPWSVQAGGPVMYLWTGSLSAWTIAHEAIHGIWNPAGTGHYYTHSDITPLGTNLDQTAKYCAGR